MAILDTIVFGIIFVLLLVYMTYAIVGLVGTIRYGWIAVLVMLVIDAFTGMFLWWFLLAHPLLTVPAIIYFSIFVAPLNLMVLFGMIGRYYIQKTCRDPYCYYPTGKVGAKKEKCRPYKKTGHYLPHEIDRISMKSYCRYIGMEFKPEELDLD